MSPLDTVAHLAGLSGSQFRDARAQMMNALARELGMTPVELRNANQVGKSVVELGAARGVSVETLQAAAEVAVKGSVPPSLLPRVPAMVRHLLNHHHHPEAPRAPSTLGGASFSVRV